jgi:hypothetical protein
LKREESEGEGVIIGRSVTRHDTIGQKCSKKYKDVKKCSQKCNKKQVEMKTRKGKFQLSSFKQLLKDEEN